MAQKMELKYGCNPHQKPSSVFALQGDLPLTVLNGRPGYINLLDALNAWQLVREMDEATGLASAASFKHVSPAGAAVGLPLSESLSRAYQLEKEPESALACAYARARGADRMSSFGDFIALSRPCDLETALIIKREVSDGVIAPSYSPEALAVLKEKRKGNYTVLQMDRTYIPPATERKEVYGLCFEQGRNDVKLTSELLQNRVTQMKSLSDAAARDLLISLITLKYTQSNSVCFVKDGQAIGVGAGQQSRIHCTRLAGQKADIWWLRQHPQVLSLPFLPSVGRPDRDNAVDNYLSSAEAPYLLQDGQWQCLFSSRPKMMAEDEKNAWLQKLNGVSLGSDAFFPFEDNILRAARSGVSFIAQPGGSIRDDQVIAACDKLGILMCMTGLRLFHH